LEKQNNWNEMEPATILEAAKWLFVAIVAPVFGWFGGAGRGWREAKRRKKIRIDFLSGLPPQAKAVLIDFHQQGTHTQRGNPGDPVIRMLASKGILQVGPGGGTYDAVDCYLTIRPDLWEVMDDWIARDQVAYELVLEMISEAAEERDRRESLPQ
jgi:hypothetical protein